MLIAPLLAFVASGIGTLCTGGPGPCFCAPTVECAAALQHEIGGSEHQNGNSLAKRSTGVAARGVQTPPVCLFVAAPGSVEKRDIVYSPVCEGPGHTFLCDAAGDTGSFAGLAVGGFCCEGQPPADCAGVVDGSSTYDACDVCGGDGCSCASGVTSGVCQTAIPCSTTQEGQSCCSGTNSNDPRCTVVGHGGADANTVTSEEKCHFGTCVGCINAGSLLSTASLCNCEAHGDTLGFQIGVSAANSQQFLPNSHATHHAHAKRLQALGSNVGLCASVTRVEQLGTAQLVLIANWTIVGNLPSSTGLSQAYLDQFVGTFSFEVIDNHLVELKCLPTTGHPCVVSTINFGIGEFCFAEFNVGDRKRDDLSSNRVVGGSLLDSNPFIQAPPVSP